MNTKFDFDDYNIRIQELIFYYTNFDIPNILMMKLYTIVEIV